MKKAFDIITVYLITSFLKFTVNVEITCTENLFIEIIKLKFGQF